MDNELRRYQKRIDITKGFLCIPQQEFILKILSAMSLSYADNTPMSRDVNKMTTNNSSTPTGTDLETKIKGTTLKCYYYLLLKNKPVGVREIQKKLGLSSPSVAAHHLSKLSELGLIRKTPDNKYEITDPVKIGFLKFFVKIFNRYLPRYSLYTGFFAGVLVAYLFFAFLNHNYLFERTVTFIVLLVSLIISSYETIVVLKESERFKE